MHQTHRSLILGFICSAAFACHAAQPDILIADFEGTNYGEWKVTGDAFGTGPAQGALPNQMEVSGFLGHGLANSYHGGDKAVGTLVSPDFTITRKYITFLIGGGGWDGKTCLNLSVLGKTVRTAIGPNTRPGGSEALAQGFWDVADLAGKTVHLEIVDNATGSWGHINVDQLVQTDLMPTGFVMGPTRTIKVEKRYLNLPVKNGAAKRRLSFLVDGKAAREFDIELAEGEPDFWSFLDLSSFKGKEAVLKADCLPENSQALKAIEQGDQIKDASNLYHETLRPQFHFSTRRGWNNDPNGLVFYQGEYHLFYQHNPYGWKWGNMHWGHAVSPDLVHWKELPIALYPDEHGTMFSGSAVVDWKNTAGFQTGSEPPLVCIFTAAGRPFTQGLAFSNDRGRTWTKYENNPVLPHVVGSNRDPKVIWYAPEKKWVLALFLEKNDYALFTSPDLKRWERMSSVTIPGTSECPEFFEIALDGKKQDTRWVFYGGNGHYLVGKFDGKTFTPDAGPFWINSGNCFYASQTYTDIPAKDGRRILVPWGQMATPGMPFNQMMGLPVELTLRTTSDGPRLFVNPVKELALLRAKSHPLPAQPLKPGDNPLAGIKTELLELSAELELGDATQLDLNLRGVPVTYDVIKQELACKGKTAGLKPVDGAIGLRLLVDRTSVDIFGNDGALYMPMGVIVPQDNRSLSLSVQGGTAKVRTLEVHELKSAWK